MGYIQSKGSQTVGNDLETKQQQQQRRSSVERIHEQKERNRDVYHEDKGEVMQEYHMWWKGNWFKILKTGLPWWSSG